MRPAPPDPSAPYHRVQHRQSGAWWRLGATVVLGIAGLLVLSLASLLTVVGVARGLGYESFEVRLDDGVDAAEIFAANAGLTLLIGWSAVLLSVLYGARARWLSSVSPGMRWEWLGRCVGIGLVVWSFLLVLGTAGALAARDNPPTYQVWAFVAVVLATTPLQAAGEEYLFRGVLMQALGATKMPTWLCCLASGLLFATAHGQFSPPLFADRLLVGMVFAWVVVRTGGLEASIALHAVKNVAVLVPAGLLDDVSNALDPSGVTWLPAAVDAVLLAIAVPWILAAHRRWQHTAAQPLATADTTP